MDDLEIAKVLGQCDGHELRKMSDFEDLRGVMSIDRLCTGFEPRRKSTENASSINTRESKEIHFWSAFTQNSYPCRSAKAFAVISLNSTVLSCECTIRTPQSIHHTAAKTFKASIRKATLSQQANP